MLPVWAAVTAWWVTFETPNNHIKCFLEEGLSISMQAKREAPFSSKLGPSVGFGSWPLFLICRRSRWLIEISGSVSLLNWICQNEIMVTETKDMEKFLTRRRSIPVEVDQWNFFTGIKGHLYPKWATNKQLIPNSSRTNQLVKWTISLFTEASKTFKWFLQRTKKKYVLTPNWKGAFCDGHQRTTNDLRPEIGTTPIPNTQCMVYFLSFLVKFWG